MGAWSTTGSARAEQRATPTGLGRTVPDDGGNPPRSSTSETTHRDLVPSRRALVAELARGAAGAATPLAVITGEPGAGRTAVLESVDPELRGRGVRTLWLRAAEADRTTPYGALYRLLTGLEPDEQRDELLGFVAKLASLPASTVLPAGAANTGRTPESAVVESVLAQLRRRAPVVLLVDDAHRLDPATAGLVERFARRCSRVGCAVIATWRTTTSSGGDLALRAPMRRLLTGRHARSVPLRPLIRAETADALTHEISALPDGALVDWFHALCRGNLSGITASATGADHVRVVDRQAYLAEAAEPPAVPAEHPLLTWLERGRRRRVAAAMAVLCPVGAAAAGLVAEVLGEDPDAVLAEIAVLVDDRILVRDPREGWRFRIPLQREALRAQLGPYLRRRLSAAGADALWDGRASSDDPGLLPDLLVEAGGLVDRQRSARELTERGGAVLFTDHRQAVRWLWAAVQRTDDPTERAFAMVAHAAACAVANRMREAVDGSRALLREHSAELDPDMLQEMEIVHATALAACGEWDELARLAERPSVPWPGREPGHEVITRGFALMLLGRWTEGERLLQERREVWSAANAITADFGYMFLGGAGVLLGDVSTLHRFIREPQLWPAGDHAQHSFEHARYEIDMLLMLGELGPARQRMQDRGLHVEQLHGPDRFLVRWLDGDHDAALDTARRSIAGGESSARPLPPVVMAGSAAWLLAGRGWLHRARQMVETGRSRHLPHVLDHVEADIRRVLGEHQEADQLMREALRGADEHGYVLGTEMLWSELALRERDSGDVVSARGCLQRCERIADQLQTGRAELARLLTRAEVLDDRDAGRAAVALARERGIPHEAARVFRRAALCGVDTAALLAESYELLGELDALLWRARLRVTMREHDVTVPGRRTSTRENERLLAVLVAEGLPNRQLAQVLATSEKSVEGRLSRMFARTGYRSRVELAAATLTGDYADD